MAMNRDRIPMTKPPPLGLSCALAMPYRSDGGLDLPRLVAHARRALAEGCGSVTAFGTTGEGPSLSLADRGAVLEAFAEAGFDFRRNVLGGVSACTVEDAAAQADLLAEAGCRAVLLAPPFYFKGVPDEGLFAWFAALFERLGGRARDVILYHIPSVTQAPLSVALVGRLADAFPEVVVGVKDSSGDWAYTQALLAARPDLAVLVGDERDLARAARLGARGSISGLANLFPRTLLPLVEGHDDPRVGALVDEVLRFPVTPAVKALIAHRTGDPGWLRVRPPLVPLSQADAAWLAARLDTLFAEAPA
jgi:4-hydroxy-tetrahydrodipicolinate synthase